MKRPERTHLSEKNLLLMGVPRQFHKLTMSDFQTYGENDLLKVKNFVKDYLDDLPNMFLCNKGMFLYGSNGVGKTYIACMIVKEAYKKRYSAKRTTFVQYINAYTKMWGAITPDEKDYLEQEFYIYYKAVEFLVLEEVGKEIDSKVSAPILEDCLRYREDHGLVTIICTNLTPNALRDKYGMSCFSLIQGNMTPVLIEGKDKRNEYYSERDWR